MIENVISSSTITPDFIYISVLGTIKQISLPVMFYCGGSPKNIIAVKRIGETTVEVDSFATAQKEWVLKHQDILPTPDDPDTHLFDTNLNCKIAVSTKDKILRTEGESWRFLPTGKYTENTIMGVDKNGAGVKIIIDYEKICSLLYILWRFPYFYRKPEKITPFGVKTALYVTCKSVDGKTIELTPLELDVLVEIINGMPFKRNHEKVLTDKQVSDLNKSTRRKLGEQRRISPSYRLHKLSEIIDITKDVKESGGIYIPEPGAIEIDIVTPRVLKTLTCDTKGTLYAGISNMVMVGEVESFLKSLNLPFTEVSFFKLEGDK